MQTTTTESSPSETCVAAAQPPPQPSGGVVRNGGKWLLTPEELRHPPPEVRPQHLEPLRKIARWMIEFLCRTHPQLGRDGPVCPFTLPALKKRAIWLTAMSTPTIDIPMLERTMAEFRDWFPTLPPAGPPDDLYKTILILYPDIGHEDARETIEVVQKRLKPSFVAQGLMVGQFYEGCPEEGLWSRDFRPLESPVPLLAIRHMVPSDFPFLAAGRGDAGMLMSYFSRFARDIPVPVRRQLSELLAASRPDEC